MKPTRATCQLPKASVPEQLIGLGLGGNEREFVSTEIEQLIE
jgi:hypothetical protein